jgi:hypothetical protein
MPLSQRARWLAFALAFIVLHVVLIFAVLLLRGPLELGRLNDIVMLGTVYLPLVPWREASVAVVQDTIQMFPTPNALGWAIILFSWALFYAALGYLLSALVGRIK